MVQFFNGGFSAQNTPPCPFQETDLQAKNDMTSPNARLSDSLVSSQ